jgi:hypothetical protein
LVVRRKVVRGRKGSDGGWYVESTRVLVVVLLDHMRNDLLKP